MIEIAIKKAISNVKKNIKAKLYNVFTVGVASLTAGALLAGSLTASAAAVAKGLLVSTQVSATGAILSTAGMAGAITYSASENFIQGSDISITDAAMNVATAGYIGYAIGSGISTVTNYINSKTGIVDRSITYLDSLDKSNSSIATSIEKATANSYIQSCQKKEVGYGEHKHNPLENVKYSQRVKNNMENNIKDPFHAFPEAVDAFGDSAKGSLIVGGDGITRTKYEIDGWYRDKEGTFEYIIEPNGLSNHRLFRPKE